MDTRNLAVGSRVRHALHGSGTVSFVGKDYLGIALDGGGEALIRRDVLEKEAPAADDDEGSLRAMLPWPASTFVFEDDKAAHYCGSHWDPFFEDAKDLMVRLPEILPNAGAQTGYGYDNKPTREVPADWPKGFELVWPQPEYGLAIILRAEKDANMLVSLFPVTSVGNCHPMTLRAVRVWDSGLEAQITASWREAEVSFFDTRYPVNRGCYEAGREYDFQCAGVAYSAGPAAKKELQVKRNPDEVAWMNQRLKEGEEPHSTDCTLVLDGTAMFLPIGEWDVDDYSFRGPVTSVEAFDDWLGQSGWRVRATVMRFGDEDADLDIMITRRAWSAADPPQVGKNIEGQLWLQGYLHSPL